MRIYIAGKITGIENEAVLKFKRAETILKGMGYEPVNPLIENTTDTWENYMKLGISKLLTCDGIYMLSNWMNSKGAKIEHNLAEILKLKIIYE